MILQELHIAYSNQLAASLHSETPSGELGKLLAPPSHCFSAALFNLAQTCSDSFTDSLMDYQLITLLLLINLMG